MSAARARRRLIAHERYRHRALKLGASPAWWASGAHRRAFFQVKHRTRGGMDPWTVPDPHRRRTPP